jgi:hypothetical protein
VTTMSTKRLRSGRRRCTFGVKLAISTCEEENDTTFAIGWKGRYRIEGPAFIYVDYDTGQLSTILGYPTHLLK